MQQALHSGFRTLAQNKAPWFGKPFRMERLTLRALALSRALALFSVLLVLADASSAQAPSAAPMSPRNAAQDFAAAFPSALAGSQRCAFCHPAEVAGYVRSAMAHALRRADAEPDGVVEAHGSKITMHSSANGYFQRWENSGEESEYRIAYVIGSGTHASGYLTDIGGHLFQSPVAFYTRRQSYDLAPGYENIPDPDFTRPVSEECVLCHSGTALHVSGTLNQYRAPVFPDEAITCERCHGPAEKHLADPRAGTIVNPAKLEPAARDSVCEQCHLFGVARVPNPGKKLSDFVAGEPLEDTFTIYHDALPPGAPAGPFKVISHVEQLALSACARNSGGRLWCGTCHDPHNKPVQPVQFYRSRCLSCHTTSFPALHPAKDSDCLGCHMPRRHAQDGGHTVFTDHRIQRRPAEETEPLAGTNVKAWREPPPGLEQRNLGIADIDVGMQRHSSSLIIQGYRALTEVQRQFPNDSDLFKWIGAALLVGKQTADAKFAFERALQLNPSPLSEAGAASPYIQDGETDRAIEHLARAVSLDPLYLPAASTLIDLYRKTGKSAEAAELGAKIKAAMNETAAPDSSAMAASSEDFSKHAEDVFKNIQVLKGLPAGQLIPTMEFISSSLGVECGYCHSEGHFEKDDKKPKRTARKMMQMTFALNKNNFDNQRGITCFTCHRGTTDPVATPVVESATRSRPDSGPGQLPVHLPAISELLENYVNALGGAASIEKINTRVETGTATFQGNPLRVEIFTRSGEKQAFLRHFPGGDIANVFDGQTSWLTLGGHHVRELHGFDLENARMDADLQFPLHLRQFYPDLRVEYPEVIAGRQAYALYAMRHGRPAAKLYFDEQSGLLLRLVRYAESPFGENPTQIDYDDYRDVDGVKVPFRMTFSQPESALTVQIDTVQQNSPIDDAQFAKPAATTEP